MHRRTLIKGLAVAAAISFAPLAMAEGIFTGSTSGVAINGYDPVGYFTMNKPVKGSPDHVVEHDGVKWRFASADNKATFEANPTKYAPKYGGHCAYAAAKGYKASTVPEAFSIVGDRLYLNYSLDVRKLWDANQANFIKSADKNWPNVK